MNPIEEWLTQPDGLAARLRALRTRAGLSGKELAERARWQPSKVSRIENGKQMPTAVDLAAWASACNAEAEADDLIRLLGEAQTARHDWKRRMRRGQVAVQTSYNELVRNARLVRHFETVYMPGLLQTAEYARRVLSEMVDLHDLAVADVDEAVAARMQRQAYLYDTTKQFEFLLAEPVLRWLLCPPDVMRGQLDRLQTVVGLPNIRFGIVPMGVPLTTAPQHAVQLYDDLAIVETFLGEITYRGDDADAHARVVDRLWEQAAVGEDARRLILRAASDITHAT
ncbi:helix-turn-helix transcriptional regulator [Plantactinospora mayteni]|uniref:Transcriptional regulator n=1 Tax=Plantactinospora mayteni TaxID=566021 RepID=A0ABQ4EXK3_9ACTN|nr:helix-turn-helix transcriptional regulator [Plantactinospora mayteni]GIG99391.1 transcriptional regulator [Plantactinospora mayteni]